MKAILKAWEKRPDNDHGKFSVLAYWSQENGELVTDPYRIKEVFLNDGNVFEPSFYLNYSSYSSNKYIIAETTVNLHEKAIDKYKLSTVVREVEYTVIKHEGFLIGDDLVDLSSLDGISTPLKNFYARYHNKYWGPFKKDNNGNVSSISAGSIAMYNELTSIFDDEIELVYEKPTQAERNIPGYTTSGINKWFRSVIQGIEHPVTLAVLGSRKWYKELKEVISYNEQLTSSQLQLALRHIKGVEITYAELKALLKHSDNQSILNSRIDSLKNEIKAELEDDIKARIIEESEELKDLLLKKNKLEIELSDIKSKIKIEKSQLQSSLQDLKNSIAEKKNSLAKIKEEENYISENKDRLLSDLRISHQVLQPSLQRSNEVHFVDYELVSKTPYDVPKDIIDVISNSLTSRYIPVPPDWQYKDSLARIIQRQGILSNSLDLVLGHLRAFGRCKVRHINVQANWLTHKEFGSCHMDKMLLEASNDSDHHYYLILQDFNIASPECYLRPFIDFMQCMVPSYKSYQGKWPENFHVVGIVLPTPEVGIEMTSSVLSAFDSFEEIPPTEVKAGPWQDSNLCISDNMIDMLKGIQIDYNTAKYAS